MPGSTATKTFPSKSFVWSPTRLFFLLKKHSSVVRPRRNQSSLIAPVTQKPADAGLLARPAGVERYSFSTPIGFSVREDTPENAQSGFDPGTKASHAFSGFVRFASARPAGVEPVTSPVTGECSNQLSYGRIKYRMTNVTDF